jgi:hypothetical protein
LKFFFSYFAISVTVSVNLNNTAAESGPKALDMGNDTKLEWAGKFCYISEVINADGETHSAVVVQISAWWKMFTRLVPFR